jgi:hypothetical protein
MVYFCFDCFQTLLLAILLHLWVCCWRHRSRSKSYEVKPAPEQPNALAPETVALPFKVRTFRVSRVADVGLGCQAFTDTGVTIQPTQLIEVLPGSPMGRAGVVSGDVVVEVDGKFCFERGHDAAIDALVSAGARFQISVASLADVTAAQQVVVGAVGAEKVERGNFGTVLLLAALVAGLAVWKRSV